jgi:hypothetical protein
MKRLCSTIAILLMTGGLALAQGGAGGSAGAGAGAGAGASGSAGGRAAPSAGLGTTGPTNPNGSTLLNGGTVGQAPGANPGNSQDLINRSNPQDLTKPSGNNPQDLKR